MKTFDLLPHYMRDARWEDLCEAVDTILGDQFDSSEKLLKYIRHQYIPNDLVIEKSASGTMIRLEDWDIPDRKTAALQTELDGLRVMDASYLDAQSFAGFHRNLPSFWYSKGTFDFIDFIAYCINQKLEMIHLWTTDHQTFLDADTFKAGESSGAYTAVYNGGPWYPTTHVRLRFYPDSPMGMDVPFADQILMARLFYDVSNLNLVLQAIEEYRMYWIKGVFDVGSANGTVASRILHVGGIQYEHFYISEA